MYSTIHLEPTNIPLGCTQKTDASSLAASGPKREENRRGGCEGSHHLGVGENIDGYEPPN